MRDLGRVLKDEKIQGIRLRPALCLPKTTPIKKVFELMTEKRIGGVIAVEGGKIVGIFTERDALTRVAEKKVDPNTPLEQLMTAGPKVLKMEDSVADAIRLMNQGSYRHVPILDQAGEVKGVLSVRNIIKYLAEHFPNEVYNLPPEPQIIGVPEGA